MGLAPWAVRFSGNVWDGLKNQIGFRDHVFQGGEFQRDSMPCPNDTMGLGDTQASWSFPPTHFSDTTENSGSGSV
jgi:hypothetical protein